jgi:hypothetical protein
MLGGVAGAVLSLANLVGDRAFFAGIFAIVIIGVAAIMLRFAAAVPVVLALLVLHLALSMRVVPEMFPVVVWRRFLCAGLRRRPEPENQKRRDHCNLNLSHTHPPFHLTVNLPLP